MIDLENPECGFEKITEGVYLGESTFKTGEQYFFVELKEATREQVVLAVAMADAMTLKSNSGLEGLDIAIACRQNIETIEGKQYYRLWPIKELAVALVQTLKYVTENNTTAEEVDAMIKGERELPVFSLETDTRMKTSKALKQ